jgi:hypothetical protein
MKDTAKRIEWPSIEVSRLPRPEDADRAQAIFDRIMTSRAYDDWRQHDPIMAASLANTSVELDKLMALTAKSGWVIGGGGKNGDKMLRTPLLDPIQHLTMRQLALARALGITGQPTDAKTVASNARLAATSREIVRKPGDSLLAGFDDDFQV